MVANIEELGEKIVDFEKKFSKIDERRVDIRMTAVGNLGTWESGRERKGFLLFHVDDEFQYFW